MKVKKILRLLVKNNPHRFYKQLSVKSVWVTIIGFSRFYSDGRETSVLGPVSLTKNELVVVQR